MESTNRPYVDPVTEPGDAGTEPWADDRADPEAGDPTKRRPLADPVVPSEEGAAIRSRRRTVGSKAGALIARSISSLPRWAPLLLAAMLAACNNGGGGSGY